MARSTSERIANIDEQMQELENQRKMLMQKQKETERKARDRRIYKRGGAIESILPETIKLTDSEFHTFLHKTAANDFGRRILAEILAASDIADAASTVANTQTAIADSSSVKPTQSLAISGA